MEVNLTAIVKSLKLFLFNQSTTDRPKKDKNSLKASDLCISKLKVNRLPLYVNYGNGLRQWDRLRVVYVVGKAGLKLGHI